MSFTLPLAAIVAETIDSNSTITQEQMQSYAEFWGIKFGGGTQIDGTWLLVVLGLSLAIISFFVSRTIIIISQKRLESQQMTKEIINGIVIKEIEDRMNTNDKIQNLIEKIGGVRDFVGDEMARKIEVDGIRRDLLQVQMNLSKMEGANQEKKDMTIIRRPKKTEAK